jgi:hypothetical protein
MDIDIDRFGGIEAEDSYNPACRTLPAGLADCLPPNLEKLNLNLKGKECYSLSILLHSYEQFVLHSLEELAEEVGTHFPVLKEIDLGLLEFNGTRFDSGLVKLREERLPSLREQFKQAGVKLWWVKPEGEMFV